MYDASSTITTSTAWDDGATLDPVAGDDDSKQLGFRVDTELLRRLHFHAGRHQTSVAEMCRRLLRDGCDRLDADPDLILEG